MKTIPGDQVTKIFFQKNLFKNTNNIYKSKIKYFELYEKHQKKFLKNQISNDKLAYAFYLDIA
tara:strand:+ start:293 stop:481 length:189 start_codon:yes stop_codon:yes gene_type:complete